MKILYIINSQKYNYHKRLLDDFRKVIPGEYVDMSGDGPLHEKYAEIRDAEPDVFISFDTAGFELRTSNDTLSLNAFAARGAVLLFHKVDFYGKDIKLRQNLSMFTYINEKDDPDKVIRECDRVPNILRMPSMEYKGDTEGAHDKNQMVAASWWNDFKKEAML